MVEVCVFRLQVCQHLHNASLIDDVHWVVTLIHEEGNIALVFGAYFVHTHGRVTDFHAANDVRDNVPRPAGDGRGADGTVLCVVRDDQMLVVSH